MRYHVTVCFSRRMSTVGVDQPDSSGQASSLEALVERLREVVQDIGAAKVW